MSNMLLTTVIGSLPAPAEVMTVVIDLPPGNPGSPPHRHPGPVFGYVLEGALRYKLEGEPERVIRAGEAFWEPGGERVHERAANHLPDAWTRFVAVMIGVPGGGLLEPA